MQGPHLDVTTFKKTFLDLEMFYNLLLQIHKIEGALEYKTVPLTRPKSSNNCFINHKKRRYTNGSKNNSRLSLRHFRLLSQIMLVHVSF